jgi:hypothetical protein
LKTRLRKTSSFSNNLRHYPAHIIVITLLVRVIQEIAEENKGFYEGIVTGMPEQVGQRQYATGSRLRTGGLVTEIWEWPLRYLRGSDMVRGFWIDYEHRFAEHEHEKDQAS